MQRSIEEIYRTGMAQKVGMEHVKSSIDGLGVPVGTDDRRLFGIELKTRVTENTRRPEIELRTNIQMGYKFVKINYKV